MQCNKSSEYTTTYCRIDIRRLYSFGWSQGMVELMVESAMPLLKSWESRIEHECSAVEIEVYEDFRSFSQDVISRACFGGSYSKGKEIFAKLMALSRLISEKRNFFEFPSFRWARRLLLTSCFRYIVWYVYIPEYLEILSIKTLKMLGVNQEIMLRNSCYQ